MANSIDPFAKHHKLVNIGGFPKFADLYYSQNRLIFSKTLVTTYAHPNHKISDGLESCFWMCPPLWTSLLVAMHDDIENVYNG